MTEHILSGTKMMSAEEEKHKEERCEVSGMGDGQEMVLERNTVDAEQQEVEPRTEAAAVHNNEEQQQNTNIMNKTNTNNDGGVGLRFAQQQKDMMQDSPVLLPIMKNAPMYTNHHLSPGTNLMKIGQSPDVQALAVAQAAAKAAADAGFYYPWSFATGAMMQAQYAAAQATLAQARGPQEMGPKVEEGGGGGFGMAANDDGYNWRKYGEKNVKGSKYPRSYYKCSTTGCNMKKIVERDPATGIISSTVLKGGEHNHPRPNMARVDVSAYVQSATQGDLSFPLMHEETVPAVEASSPPQKRRKKKAVQAQVSAEEDVTLVENEDSGKTISQDGDGDLVMMLDEEKEDVIRDSAVMALQLLGTGFSPDMPALGPGMSGTPANLIPLPATLRSSPLVSKEKSKKSKKQFLYDVYSTSVKDAPPELLDLGEVNSEDEWEVAEEDFGLEDHETVNAAIAAAAAYINKETREISAKPLHMRSLPPDFSILDDDDDDKSSSGHRSGDTPPEGGNPIKKIERKSNDKTIIRTETDSDQVEDGYKWRKYGQKVVKGNPHPRSYYKCTSTGCKVRKQVERCNQNVRILITTYEGKHTHDPPLHRTHPAQGIKMPGDQGYMAQSKMNQALASPALAGCFPMMMSPGSLMMNDGSHSFMGQLPFFPATSPTVNKEASEQFANAMATQMNTSGVVSPAQLQFLTVQQAAQQRLNAHLVQHAKAWQEAFARSPKAMESIQAMQKQGVANTNNGGEPATEEGAEPPHK